MTDPAPSYGWLLAVPFLAIGLALLGSGLAMLRRGLRVYRFGAVVDAEVVGVETFRQSAADKRAPGDFGGSTVIPNFRYRTADGQRHEARLAHQAKQRLRSERYRLRYAIGSTVPIRLDPDQPGVAYEYSIGSLLVLPVLLVFAGTLVSLIALGIFFG